jgi:glutamine amidotransferase-like uncharacterized protein
MLIRMFRLLVVFFAFTHLTGCNGLDGALIGVEPAGVLPDTSVSDPKNDGSGDIIGQSTPPVSPPTQSPTPEPTVLPKPVFSVDVMLFNGVGVSTSDWQTTEKIVKTRGWSYRLVNSAALNLMSVDDMASFGVIIVPGGSGGTITSNLTTDTRLRIRQAVRERGVSYVGFCAGAWVAVGPEAETTKVASYGLAVAKGNVLGAYYPNGNTSLTAAIVKVGFPTGVTRSLVWWGGPYTPEWSNGVIARYSDGRPAISETWAGNGYVVISGPHPEAPEGWRATAGYDPDGLDYDIAIQMIDAALRKQALPTF